MATKRTAVANRAPARVKTINDDRVRRSSTQPKAAAMRGAKRVVIPREEWNFFTFPKNFRRGESSEFAAAGYVGRVGKTLYFCGVREVDERYVPIELRPRPNIERSALPPQPTKTLDEWHAERKPAKTSQPVTEA